jgi:hypothetical protein
MQPPWITLSYPKSNLVPSSLGFSKDDNFEFTNQKVPQKNRVYFRHWLKNCTKNRALDGKQINDSISIILY